MAFTNYIQKITDTGGTTHDLLDSSASHFIRGTQTASTNVWTGPLPDGVSNYYDGLMIDYFLPFAGTSTAATLNLGGKGAKPIYRGNSPTSGTVTTHFPVNSVIHLTYVIQSDINSGNGAWIASAYYDSNSNDTSTGYTRFSHGTYTTTTAVGRYVICLSKSPTSVVPVTAVNDSTATTKTLTTDTFNPFEPIFYYTNNGSTTQTAANAALSVSYLWRNYSNINLGYSFNTGTTLTNNKDVYIKATPTSGYMATLASTPIVQALPSTDDGFIYIKLGHACSTSNIAMSYEHPIYWYKNGAVRPYGGDAATINGISAKLGYTTSGNNRAVQADSNGNLYVTQKDDNSNTTYSLSGALSSHKFTSTLTAGGSGSGTSTSNFTLAAGTGITITDDTSARKMTITCSVTNTDTKVTSSANHYTPSTASGNDKTASASGATAAWSIDVVKGITINTDGKGHITGLSVTSGKIPANPNTDTKVSTAAVTSGSNYYPVVGADTTSAATKFYDKTGFTYAATDGTTSNVGSAILMLGNNKGSGTAGNKLGQLTLYGATGARNILLGTITGANTQFYTNYLPNQSGTIALIEDIPAAIVTTITTTAGTHTTKNNVSGAVSMTIPTKTSHLTNDSGFLTSHQDLSDITSRLSTLENSVDKSSSFVVQHSGASVQARKMGNLMWVQYKYGPMTLGQSSTVALISVYADSRPLSEVIVPALITDSNYHPVGSGLARFETGGWVYIVSGTSLTQTSSLYIMFTAIYALS